ncbi:MAG: HAD hydrolase family protein [Dehalococcoidia bacterium]
MLPQMARTYATITRETALRIKLIMTDVDGTLNSGGDELSPEVSQAMHDLKEHGIMVGLVSGRTDPMLVAMASGLDIGGPLIAENGAVARMSYRSALVDLGYSRQPAIHALEKLKIKYPGRIKEREDNAERLIDIVCRADGIEVEELRDCVRDVQLLDSTYILHLMQKGIDKGTTLKRLLGLMDGQQIKPEEVLVVGDSMTDLSLFKLFTQSVLIPNPDLPETDKKTLRKVARYITEHGAGRGFAEVALHIISART